MPNGSGEKAKGAILSRAVQYIHHLKENEARNIEKWTLEKLLMDQAMGDLQAQLEEMRRMWEEERMAKSRAESELDVLRGLQVRGGGGGAAGAAGAGAGTSSDAAAAGGPPRSGSPEGGVEKRERDNADEGKEGEEAKEGDEETRLGKRQRVD